MIYLRETLKAGVAHIGRPQPYRQDSYLFIDDVTRRSLELVHTLRDGTREGSLLLALDRTVTAMGASGRAISIASTVANGAVRLSNIDTTQPGQIVNDLRVLGSDA